ncbi:MAG: TonB-dependent receptor, partial [Bacteroidaceae bacterium]|nr:TonB-dependent receptor [Bacteroidaceae bacterium]
FYNSAGQPLADMKGGIASGLQSADHIKTTIMLDGVNVGGSAQTTAALGARVKLMKGLSIAVDYNYFARNFADFDVQAGDIAAGKDITFADPWKIPAGSQIDVSAKYNFQLGGLFSTFYANVDNLMDTHYIVDAYDGGNGEWQSANRLFYSFGRTYSVRLKVRF